MESKVHVVRNVAVVLLVVVLSVGAFAGPAAAHGGDDGSHHHDGWMGTHGSWGGLGFLWMLVWGLVLAVSAAFLYAYVVRGDVRDGPGDDALATLRSRYARGEIDDEEFEKRRERLSRADETR